MRLAAVHRAKNPAVGENQNLIGVGPVDDAIAAVAILHMAPKRTGLDRRPVVLQPREDDARVSRMLGDEVAAQAGKAVVLGRELARAAGIAVEKHASIASAPKFVRIVRAVYQGMHVGMRMLADRGLRRHAPGCGAGLNFTTPNRSAAQLPVIAAAEVDDISLLGVDGDREVVVALRPAPVDRQDVRHAGHRFPCLADTIKAIEAVQETLRVRHERVEQVGISRLHAECNAADTIGWKSGAGSLPRFPVRRPKDFSPIAALRPARREESYGSRGRCHYHAGEDAGGESDPFKLSARLNLAPIKARRRCGDGAFPVGGIERQREEGLPRQVARLDLPRCAAVVGAKDADAAIGGKGVGNAARKIRISRPFAGADEHPLRVCRIHRDRAADQACGGRAAGIDVDLIHRLPS